jgi:site-specific DNA-methyltransferase (cytosine-N4-specific)
VDTSHLDAYRQPFYTQQYGSAYLGDSLELLSYVQNDQIQLILTSPPFALTSKKEYGNKSSDEYVDWFLGFAKEFKRVLRPDGSFVVDLGGAFLPGHPVRSIYQFELLVRLCKELGFFLAQEFYHYNPARLPGPAEWTNVRRIRVKDSVNVVWWLSKSEYPKANNRNVLRPYTEAMKQLLQNGYRAKKRPSGHNITPKFSRENEGAIPPNLLELGNNDSNSSYMRRCNEAGIKPHPARFPKQFAEFFIKFLTDEGDLVLDPFAGSNTTGYVAEALARQWLAFELNEPYLEGSRFRFEDNEKRAEGSSPEQQSGDGAKDEIFQVNFITKDHVYADIITLRTKE